MPLPAHSPRRPFRALALPPSLRRRARASRGRRALAPGVSHAVLRAALRALLALPPESAGDADRAVARIMHHVRAGA